MKITLFNSLSGKKEDFIPLDPKNVTMYVCGPTVYERPHIGNARSIVVYDMLFRLLKQNFPKVTYIRNITDLDDKINDAALKRKITVGQLTKEITEYFHQDVKALDVLRPTFEPRATEHIKEMILMISKMIANKNAYISDSHVLFDVRSYENYGELSKRSLDEMIAGSRVEIAKYKKDPLDFVLWKPASTKDDPSIIFDSPWGKGRPGWHIECSAMSSKYLGNSFDIHGGGSDLRFPHHENEIAQIRCYDHDANYAKYWVHNGFLTVNGEKMSKSLGNFVTVKDLLDKSILGVAIRYFMLTAHYRKPLDFNEKALSDSKKAISKFYKIIGEIEGLDIESMLNTNQISPLFRQVNDALADDLNTPLALSTLHQTVTKIENLKTKDEPKKMELIGELVLSLDFIGLLDKHNLEKVYINQKKHQIDENYILTQIGLRKKARMEKDWEKSDKIRSELLKNDIIIEDGPDGQILWKRK